MSSTVAGAARPRLSIVVPCYDESDNGPRLERELFPVVSALARRWPVEVVFVDDGSRDGTPAVLESLARRWTSDGVAVHLTRHDRNRGLGAALRTGFAAARGDIVVTTDADATYRFEEIPALIDALTPDVDLVTASPYHPQGAVVGVPAHRLVLSRGSSWIYRILVSRRLHTYTCLFRAYRREVIETVPFGSDGFLAGTELLVNAVLAGYRAAEYPAVLHSRMFGVSKARLTRTVFAHLGYQARVLCGRLRLAREPWAGARLRRRALAESGHLAAAGAPGHEPNAPAGGR
jgi:dolichol-phosphate mannosyltransferase